MKEEIYESSSSSTATNRSSNSNSNNSDSNTFISKNITVDSNLSVMASLEIFNNRIYFNDDNNRNDNMTNNDTNITMINENPNIKYSNIKKELESLDKDLKELLSTSSKPDDANLWAMLQAETTRLRDRAEGIASHKGFQLYEKATLSSLEKIEEASKKITSSSTTTTTSTPTTASSPSIKEPSISLSSLDQRMFTIETMLGYSSSVLESSTSLSSPAPGVDMTINGRGLAIPLIDTIAKIENKLKLITSQSSSQESLIKKCEALKIELDSVNSIISTSSSSSSSSSSSAATNLFNVAKSVDDLYEKAQIIEGISPDLPKILNRLQYLEQLSSLSSSFDKRVDTMKGEIDNIRTLLNTNNDSITIMKSNLSEQMSALADACKKLKK